MALTGLSISTPVQTPQSQFALSVAQATAGVGSYLTQWAQNVYAQTSAITNQMVSSFLSTSQYGMTLAQTQLNQYENTTIPEMQQLANEAGDYSSNARIDYNMGAAESDAAQAAGAANQGTLQNLRSYGVDPSSGMYGDILAAQNTAAGAAEAGAGQQAQINTENQGRTLLNQSIAAGQQLPGDTVNALNSAYQGIQGAENSVLSNANTGSTAMGVAAPFDAAAINLKYPTNATISEQASAGSAGGGSGGGSGSQFGQMANLGQDGPNPVGPNITSLAPDALGQLNSGPPSGPPAGGGGGGGHGGGGGGQTAAAGAVQAGAQNMDLSNLPQYQGGSGGTGYIPGGAAGVDPNAPNFNEFGSSTDPTTDAANLANSPFSSASDSSAFGNTDTSFGIPGATSQSFDADPGAGWGDFSQPSTTDWSGGSSNLGVDASQSGFSGGMSPSQASGYGGGGAGDQGPTQYGSGGSGYSGSGYSGSGYKPPPQIYGGGAGGGYYAKGGRVQRNFRPGVLPVSNATTGGRVPMQASPSQGRQTDDVPARLNAGEFVIPKDVAAWKGQEFFQKLIDGSRKKRVTGSPAQGQMKPPLSGPPRFVSQGAQHGQR